MAPRTGTESPGNFIAMTTRSRAASLGLAGAASFALAVSSAAGLPQSMRAMAIDKAGDPLTLHTLPLPKPAPNEVLIEVHVAAVAIWDVTLQRSPVR